MNAFAFHNCVPRGARSLALGLALALIVGLSLCPGAGFAARVSGVVRDRAGAPVEFANVRVVALQKGATTNAEGRFQLELPAGPVSLEVSQIGYQRSVLAITVSDEMPALTVTLAEEPVPVAEVSVEASSFGKAGKGEGAVLRRIDVVTTPGGTADVFQSLRTLPGINAPNEGAAVYVRGGDPNETLIRLDSGEIGHPYHYEGASGGLFSTIDSYMLKSAFFSSGGFSAKYGGVLSGVLDIVTQEPLGLKTVSVGANLAGWNASTSWALIPDKLALIGSVGQGLPELLFKIYGTSREYQTPPTSLNGFGKLLARYSPTGRASLSYLDSGDNVSVWSNQLNVLDLYHERAHNQFLAANISDLIGGRLALRGQASGQFYESRWSYGDFGASHTERNAQANLDAVFDAGARHQLGFGFNLRHRDTEIVGAFPADSTDLGSGAPIAPHVSRPKVEYPGVYLEDKMRLFGPLYATLGVRADFASSPGVWTTDPRAALAWRVSDRQTVRVAAGRYHQLPDPQYLDPTYGNPDLGPLRADHLIAGYEWKSEFGNVRVEAYDKRYHGLVTNDAEHYYTNAGTGYARGVDTFVQGTYQWLSGWVSYGYMDSRRRELDDPTEVPSAYGVRHSITLVSQFQATPALQIGARYSASSGRPYTPVVGSTFDATQNLWRPVYGDHGSEEMPAYQRLDLRLTRLFSLPAAGALRASSVCVFYIEGLNVLGIANVLDYVYNSDYSERHARLSYFSRRMLVAGFQLSW